MNHERYTGQKQSNAHADEKHSNVSEASSLVRFIDTAHRRAGHHPFRCIESEKSDGGRGLVRWIDVQFRVVGIVIIEIRRWSKVRSVDNSETQWQDGSLRWWKAQRDIQAWIELCRSADMQQWPKNISVHNGSIVRDDIVVAER